MIPKYEILRESRGSVTAFLYLPNFLDCMLIRIASMRKQQEEEEEIIKFCVYFFFFVNNDCDSINCSIPDKGLTGVRSRVDLGHNSGGRSLNLIDCLSKEQISFLISEPESLEGRGMVSSDVIV